MQNLTPKYKLSLNNCQSHTGYSFQNPESEQSGEKSRQKPPQKIWENFPNLDRRILRSREWEKFRRFYRDRRLSDCLEILEKQGFSGDSAIFALALVGGES